MRDFLPKVTSGSIFGPHSNLASVSRKIRKDPMSLFNSISFFEVSMALVFVGIAERVLMGYAPASMVGRDGWLLRTSIEE